MAEVIVIQNELGKTEKKRLRVGAYARVSSNSLEQEDSFHNQVRYYTKHITSNPEWEFVDIYADEGITGTRQDKRDDFNRMIQDAEDGKLDLIVVKSISRFARNTVDCIRAVEKLNKLGVAVKFEDGGLNTSTPTDTAAIKVSSALAQEESQSIALNVRIGTRNKMRNGTYIQVNAPYGYSYKDKQLIINEEQAEVVRKIFTEYIAGKGTTEIAKMRKNMHQQGFVDDSIFDYDNKSVPSSGRINWNSLKSDQRKAITFVKGLFTGLGSNLVFVGKNKKFNGMYHVEGDTIFIDAYAGMDVVSGLGKDSIIPTTSHELTHQMEKRSPKLFDEVKEIVLDTLEKTMGLSRNEISSNEIERLNEKHPDEEHDENDAISEIVAKACEDMLAASEEGIQIFNSLSESEQKTLTEKIKDIISKIKDWLTDLLKLYPSKSSEAQAIRSMQDAFDEISKRWDAMLSDIAEQNKTIKESGAFENRKSADGLKFQTRSVNGNEVVWIDENILKMNDGKPVHQFIANFIAEHIGDVYTIIESGQKVYIGEDLPGEYTQSEYTQKVLQRNPNIIKAKNKATANIKEIIEIATNRRWEKTKHANNKDGKYGMYRYDTRFGFPVQDSNGNIVKANIYKAELVIRNASDGRKYLYDIVDIKKDTVSSDWLSNKIASAADFSAGQKNDVSNSSISDSSKNVNTKFSDRDSAGRKLSEGQQEFFKDSAVRDNDGNLLVMYHGTNAEFTVFEQGHKRTRGFLNLGEGFYFTPSKSMAENYDEGTNNFRIIDAYLNVKKPFEIYGPSFEKEDFERVASELGNHTKVTRDNITEILKKLGYDGVISRTYNGADNPISSVAVFDSSQAKLTSNLNPTKDKDVRYSDRETEITEDDYKNMKNHFGVTGNFNVAGYMLKNGSMLDFSGKHWGDTTSKFRQVDHRDIQEALPDENNGIDSMVNMISNGNIRLMPEIGGINLAVAPSKNQRTVLRRYIEYMSPKEGIMVDIDEVGGDTIKSFEYDKGVSADRVIRDIDNYFKGGTQSDLMRFHTAEGDGVLYSDRYSDDFIDKTIKSFGIQKLGDFIHVQKQVLNTLIEENFFTDAENRRRVDVNKDSGMIIETNKSGIDETFDLNNYAHVGKNKKITKLATIRMLPEIIKNGKLVSDNVQNKYGDGNSKKFAYIEYTLELDGKEVTIQLDIKKSPQKNKFWVHRVLEKENVSNSPTSTNDGTEAGHSIADIDRSISHLEENVKYEICDIPYQVRYVLTHAICCRCGKRDLYHIATE